MMKYLIILACLCTFYCKTATRTISGQTDFIECVRENDLSCAESTRKRLFVDINKRWRGETALQVAVHNNASEMVEFLLQHKANPNSKDSHGQAPLHIASMNNNIKIIKLLHEYHANPFVATNEGLNSLDFSTMFQLGIYFGEGHLGKGKKILDYKLYDSEKENDIVTRNTQVIKFLSSMGLKFSKMGKKRLLEVKKQNSREALYPQYFNQTIKFIEAKQLL